MGLLPNPWIILAAGVIWLSTAVGGFFYGSHTRANADAANLSKAVIAAQQATQARQMAEDKITLVAAVKQAQSQQIVEHEFTTIEQKVPIYVAKTDGCPLSNGYLRLWNAGVAGEANALSATSGKPDAAAAGVTAVDALNNAVRNFEIAHETSERLRNLQDWILQQEQVK